jgi:hypothetical protein
MRIDDSIAKLQILDVVDAAVLVGTCPHAEVVERVQMTGDAVLLHAGGKIP